MTLLARTDFLRIVAVAGSAWTLGLEVPRVAQAATEWSPVGWVSLGADGLVTVMVNKAEMGQGVTTSLPMLVAEELEMPLDRDAQASRLALIVNRVGTRPVAMRCRPAAVRASNKWRR